MSLSATHPAAPAGPQRILLVEDEPGDAMLITLQLQQGRTDEFDVYCVQSMAQVQALSAAADGFRPDVVLLDLNLPDCTGAATVTRCRSLIDAPIVVLTGLDEEAANREAIESGAEDYLVKGGDGSALRKAVRYARLRFLRDRDARLANTVFSHAHEGILITDPAGHIIDVNPAVCRLTGYSPQDLLGQHPRMLLSPVHRPESFTDQWRDIMQGGTWQGERLNRHKDGHDYPVWESITPCRNGAGRITQFIDVITDISERKRAEAQLLRSTELLRGAIEAIDEAFVLYDADDRMVFCNDKYRQIYHTSADLIVPGARFEDILREGARRGQYPAALGHEDDWVSQRMVQHRQANHALTQRLDDGRVMRIIERQLPDGSTVGFRIDITDLVRARDDAQAANLAKSRFLATMSHEIRTPMNGILGMAQLLLTPGLDERDRLDYAQTVLSSGQSLLSLLNDILDLSKIEAGKFQLDLSEFEPQRLLHEVQALFAGAAKNKGLQLDCHWHGEPAERWRSDSHRLRQMLSNLVGNAIKFTASGRVHCEGRVLEQDAHGAVMEFAVTDTGMGIAPEKLALLFKPFSQTDSSTTRQFGGTGLGLSIVSSLARLLGGEVGVQSEPGKGSRFWFRVRAEPPGGRETLDTLLDDLENIAEGPSLERAEGTLSGQVLVVEDNPVNCMVIEGLLHQMGLQVSLSHDGLQAVQRLQQALERPDLILMDLQMPVMDGYAATRAVRDWEASLGRGRMPIIALTADAFEEDRQRCLSAGMDDFLTKPIARGALFRALDRWLPGRPAAPAPAPAPAVRPLDRVRFAQITAELLPLLQQQRFDAIDRFESLRRLSAQTELADAVAELEPLLRQLHFDQAAQRLAALVAQADTQSAG